MPTTKRPRRGSTLGRMRRRRRPTTRKPHTRRRSPTTTPTPDAVRDRYSGSRQQRFGQRPGGPHRPARDGSAEPRRVAISSTTLGCIVGSSRRGRQVPPPPTAARGRSESGCRRFRAASQPSTVGSCSEAPTRRGTDRERAVAHPPRERHRVNHVHRQAAVEPDLLDRLGPVGARATIGSERLTFRSDEGFLTDWTTLLPQRDNVSAWLVPTRTGGRRCWISTPWTTTR